MSVVVNIQPSGAEPDHGSEDSRPIHLVVHCTNSLRSPTANTTTRRARWRAERLAPGARASQTPARSRREVCEAAGTRALGERCGRSRSSNSRVGMRLKREGRSRRPPPSMRAAAASRGASGVRQGDVVASPLLLMVNTARAVFARVSIGRPTRRRRRDGGHERTATCPDRLVTWPVSCGSEVGITPMCDRRSRRPRRARGRRPGLGDASALLHVAIQRDGDRGEKPDDRHDDQELDQREAR